MNVRLDHSAIFAAILTMSVAPSADAGQCGSNDGIAVQILGSGGPELASGRASSSYLIWHDGRARVLVDLGAGAMLRFGQSGARVEDLEFLGISHLHVDHSADVPALIKSSYFGSRSKPLPAAGPGPGAVFPGVNEWLGSLFSPEHGSFRYLAGALDGSGGQFELAMTEVPTDTQQPVRVFRGPDLEIEAMSVPHGAIPTLAYRIDLGGTVVVFGSDQNGQQDAFWKWAGGADLLVAHMAIPEDAQGVARALHAVPSRIGGGAAQAGVRILVLSHFMTRSEAAIDDALDIVRREYRGPITLASDLACVTVPARQLP